jgi:hypothetical protein
MYITTADVTKSALVIDTVDQIVVANIALTAVVDVNR